MSGKVEGRAPAMTFLNHLLRGGLIDKGRFYVVGRIHTMHSGGIRG